MGSKRTGQDRPFDTLSTKLWMPVYWKGNGPQKAAREPCSPQIASPTATAEDRPPAYMDPCCDPGMA